MDVRWDKVKRGAQEGLSAAAEAVELIARKGRVKLDISAIKEAIGKTEKQLGRYIYALVSTGECKIAEDEEIKRLVERIGILEGDLREKQAQH
jgi:hypothetical protein